MMLEAVWLKNGKEIYKVSPVMNIVCDDNMKNFADIEVESDYKWHSCKTIYGGVDDFIVRVKRG